MPFYCIPSDDPAVTSLSKKKEFDELTHWHSSRPLSDDFERTKCNSDGKYNGYHQHFQHSYRLNCT